MIEAVRESARARGHGRRQPGLAHAGRPHASLGSPHRARLREELERLDVYWLEEPLPTDDLDGYAALRDRADVRIAAGEFVRTAAEARDLVCRGGVDVVQPDVVLVAG